MNKTRSEVPVSGLPQESTERLEAVMLRILKRRHGYVVPIGDRSELERRGYRVGEDGHLWHGHSLIHAGGWPEG